MDKTDRLVDLAVSSNEYGATSLRQWKVYFESCLLHNRIHIAYSNNEIIALVTWHYGEKGVYLDLLAVDKEYKGNKVLLVRNLLKDTLNTNRWDLKTRKINKVYWKASRYNREKGFSIRR